MGESARPAKYTVVWRPNPAQAALIRCPVFEVFYGGARGGGKSDGTLGEWAVHASRYGDRASGLMVRRERAQLYDLIERSRQIYTPLGARLTDNVWRFPDGARLRFAYLERDADADAYQGHSYTRVYVEEAGTFPRPAPVMKLMATVRSGSGVPCGMRLTGNPGGVGHQWLKERYIDPAPLGWKIMTSEFENPFTGAKVTRDRVYIPSRLSENPYLGDDYVANLHMSGSPELVRAWLEGDWNVIEGAYFPEFRTDLHVIEPFAIPKHWICFRAMDWGSARPFSVGWYAVSAGDTPKIPKGALVKYREWYGMKDGQPNVGLKLTAEEVAKGIRARETKSEVLYGVLDPSAFAEDGGPSIAERMGKSPNYVTFRPADNRRVREGGAMGGWDQVRARLKGEDASTIGDVGVPMLYFFRTCVHTVRTLPALQHDSLRPEDVDSEGEDHAADETRYACMSRPYQSVTPKPKEPPRGPRTIEEMARRFEERQEDNRRI